MDKIKNVAVLGAGALGLMYEEALYSVLKEHAYFLADERRRDTFASKGFVINGQKVNFPCRTKEELKEHPDLLLLCVKNHHLKSVEGILKKACGPETTVISVLNGINSEKYLEEILPSSTVLYSAVLGMDAVKESNELNYSCRGKFIIGTKNNEITAKLKAVSDLLESCGFPVITPDDIHKELWYKWMINIGINQPSALMGAPYGVFQNEGPARNLMNEAMEETIAVAEAADVDLNSSDIERWYSVLSTLGPQGKTSMLQDMEAERKTEVESFSGELIRLAEEKGISVPINRTLNRLIRTKESLYLM